MANEAEERPTISSNNGTLTPFLPGERRVGRAAGTPNKTARILKEAILLAAEWVGNPEFKYNAEGQIVKRKRGKGGLNGYLRYVALYEPKSFCALLARVLPVTIKAEHYSEKKVFKSLDQMRQDMEERGLPIGEIMQSARVLPFGREEE